jgi:preprotein translocase subunit SecE
MAESNKKNNNAKPKQKRNGIFKGIAKFFRDYVSEIKKVSWPTAALTTKNTGTVLLSIITIGLFVFALDSGLYALLKWTIGVSNPDFISLT